jgi:hypothetical protein
MVCCLISCTRPTFRPSVLRVSYRFAAVELTHDYRGCRTYQVHVVAAGRGSCIDGLWMVYDFVDLYILMTSFPRS